MLSSLRRKAFRSLAFRLSLNYAACCLLSMMAVFLVSYLFLDASLRREIDGDLANEIPEYRSLLASQSIPILEDTLQKEALSEGIDQVFFRILDPSGAILFGTDTRSWSGLTVDHAALQSALSGQLVFADFENESGNFTARLVYGAIAENKVLQLGESLAGNHGILRQFREIFTVATLAFVFCSLLAGAYMAQRALSGVQRVTEAARFITAGAWEHRVPVSGNQDEIDELADAFNTMVNRIEVLFRELRDVTDDIAHDLRTPLMRIRGEAEMALIEADHSSLEQERCGSVLEECDEMLQFINTMLEISQTEAGAAPLDLEALSLGPLVEDVCELFRPVAEDKSLTLSCTLEALPPIRGEALRLNRVLVHLLDNAVKYTPAGGEIVVTGQRMGDDVVVQIRDTGIGIGSDALGEVFNRFYRADASRTTPGNGLGLSLARAIVRAHEGDITVSSVEGEGSCFTVRLPVAGTGPRP